MAPKMKRPTSPDSGISVFRDDEEIRKGEEIGNEVLTAIDQSTVFVPIFSKGYASSKWCLMELAKMSESLSGGNKKKILPIFYDVSVDDVKLKTELYTKALTEHTKMGKFSTNTVQQWEEALRGAGSIKGYELKDQGHGKFAKSFVRDISLMLKENHKLVTDYLVQRDDQVEAIMKQLDIDSREVRFLGIHGMAGIGKSTLARIVFNKLYDRFDQSCFLADVRESSNHHKGIEKLQEQLLKSAGVNLEEIMHKDEGVKTILKMPRRKLLLVLDDISHYDQLEYLAGDATWFGYGSRIIITTRDQSILSFRCQTMEVKIMNSGEALQLFSMHAFDEDCPPNDYLSLSIEAVASTGGLPLALEVIGSLLKNKKKEYWVNIIKSLKESPHEDVEKKLMISYEALKHEAKQIFLDIACFFIGHDKTYPIYMWEACKFTPNEGLQKLIHMSLVKIVEEEGPLRGVMLKKLWMHDQLRDMGRYIAGRSRIWWHHVDPSELVPAKEPNETLEMLRLRESKKKIELKLSLPKLRYLRFEGIVLDMKKDRLPRLTWLSWLDRPVTNWDGKKGALAWRDFSLTLFKYVWWWGHNRSCLKNLVVLDVSYSDLNEHWEGWKHIGKAATKLKVLDLSYCNNLKMTPDLSNYTSLERLILRACSKLVGIHRSIRKLVSLEELHAIYCHLLVEIPLEIGECTFLRVLDLRPWGDRQLPTELLRKLSNLTDLRLR